MHPVPGLCGVALRLQGSLAELQGAEFTAAVQGGGGRPGARSPGLSATSGVERRASPQGLEDIQDRVRRVGQAWPLHSGQGPATEKRYSFSESDEDWGPQVVCSGHKEGAGPGLRPQAPGGQAESLQL